MKISEYIAALETIKAEHGDLEVQTYSFDASRVDARAPSLAFTRVLFGRERKPSFYDSFSEAARKGRPVCRV